MYVLNYSGELNAQAARQAISEGLDRADLTAPAEIGWCSIRLLK
jgi:hypothetical protein